MSDFPTLTIRGQRPDDQDALYALLTNQKILRDSLEIPYMAEEVFRERYGVPPAETHTLILETGLPSGRRSVVGAGWLQPIKRRRRRHTGEVSLVIHPDFQNGEADAALLDAVIELGERWLGLRRLQGAAFAADAASIALFESRGFVHEATYRQYAVRDGEYADAVEMARVVNRPEQTDQARQNTSAERESTSKKFPPSAIAIRALEGADWEDISEMLASGNVAAYTLQTPYQSRDIIRDRVETPQEEQLHLVAVVKERVVGELGLHPQEGRRAHAAGLGMMVHADYQGRGIGTALMNAAVEFAERWLNIRRLELEVYTDNLAGIALYEKFGFEIEGTLRDYAFRDGRYVDTYVMAHIQEDSAE